MLLRTTTSSMRSRYFTGDSPSSLSGNVGVSRGRFNELLWESGPGVPVLARPGEP